MVPALLSGVVWALGNIALLRSTSIVGVAAGFTFSQLGFVIATLGSIFLLKEPRTRKEIVVVLVGIAAALAGVVLVGCARLAVVLVVNHSTVTGAHAALGAGGPGSVLLALAQMPWIPSMALWACSWTLGAGFSLGQGALVAPIGSSTGDLPTIPLLAAMSTGDAHPAMIAVWLLAGALAGAVGAHVCVRARHDDARRALPEREFRPDEGALYGLVVGVLAALLLCLLALLSHGALGTRRLAELGPLLGRLLVLAPTVLGAGGMLGGFVTALRLGRGGNG